MKYQTMITAHTGCEGTQSNTLESMERGIASGADCVEVDVRRDAEGQLCMSHDAVGEQTDYILLSDAFSLVRKRSTAINCDLKEYKIILSVLELAEEFGLEREQLILSGAVDTFLLRDRKDIAGRCRLFLNTEELARDLLPGIPMSHDEEMALFHAHPVIAAKRFHDLRADALNVLHSSIQDGMTEEMHELGISISIWSVDDRDDVSRWFAENVMNITTRNVAEAVAIRAVGA